MSGHYLMNKPLDVSYNSDDIIYSYFNNFLEIYDDMIEEAKSMSGGLLSNEYIYLKPVFQDIFNLILDTVKVKERTNPYIKDESEDEDFLTE